MDGLPRDILCRIVRLLHTRAVNGSRADGDDADTLPARLAAVAAEGPVCRWWIRALWDGVVSLRVSFAPRGGSDGSGWLYVLPTPGTAAVSGADISLSSDRGASAVMGSGAESVLRGEEGGSKDSDANDDEAHAVCSCGTCAAAAHGTARQRLLWLAAQVDPARLTAVTFDFGGARGCGWRALWRLAGVFLRAVAARGASQASHGSASAAGGRLAHVGLLSFSPDVRTPAGGLDKGAGSGGEEEEEQDECDDGIDFSAFPGSVRSMALSGGCVHLAGLLPRVTTPFAALESLAVDSLTNALVARLVGLRERDSANDHPQPASGALSALRALDVAWDPSAVSVAALASLGDAIGSTLASLSVRVVYAASSPKASFPHAVVREGLTGLVRRCASLATLELSTPLGDDALVLELADLRAQLSRVVRFGLSVARASESDMSDFIMAELVSAMPLVASVELRFAYVSDCVCRVLASLRHLRRVLIAGSVELTGQSLELLSAAHALRRCAVELHGDDVDVANRPNRGPIRNITHLAYVCVDSPRDVQASVARLAPRCPDLRELRFENSALPFAPDVLPRVIGGGGCPLLRRLCIRRVHWTGVPGGLLATLASVEHLREIVVSGVGAAAVAVERAPEIASLRAAGKTVVMG